MKQKFTVYYSKKSSSAQLDLRVTFDNYDEVGVYTRGYRILSKVPRMPANIVENLVLSFKSFQHILDADIHKKTIQKAIESYRISDEVKSYLRTLK